MRVPTTPKRPSPGRQPGFFTPRKISPQEGKRVTRRDILKPKHLQFSLTSLRSGFDAICRQMAKKDPQQRLRYIRHHEAAITLDDLRAIAMRVDREVGIFLDTEMLAAAERGERHRLYTPICLFASDNRNYLYSRVGTAAAGASIGYPDCNPARFRMIAHFHPTQSRQCSQLKLDLQKAGQQIEMVVNVEGSIFFYQQERCYNKKEVRGGEPCYLRALADGLGDDTVLSTLTMRSPITVATVAELDTAHRTVEQRRLDREIASARESLASLCIEDQDDTSTKEVTVAAVVGLRSLFDDSDDEDEVAAAAPKLG